MGYVDYPTPGQVVRTLVKRATLANGHPNLDPNTNEVPIAPLGLFPADKIRNVIVFPALIDVARLKKALAQVLAVWPILTSHFMSRADGVDFYYDTTNVTAPLSIQSIEQESPFPSTDVMQPDLEPFLEPLDANFALHNSKTYQITFRLTRLVPHNQSVLGVNFAHQLGDGHTAHRFLRQFSDFYAKELDGDSITRADFPSFYPSIEVPPVSGSAASLGERFKFPTLPVNDVLDHYEHLARTHTLTTYAIPLEEVKAMKAEARARTDTILSTSNLITAWWATVQERRDGTPREQVALPTNSIRTCFARPEFPPNLPTLAANCLHVIFAQCPSSGKSDPAERMVEIALAMRRQIEHDRNHPDFVLDAMAKQARVHGELAKDQTARNMRAPPNMTFVNSMLAFDWIFNFGFPKEQVSYHTTHPREEGSRLYRANCRPGQKLEDCGYELATYTPKSRPEMLEKVEEIVKADRERWTRVRESSDI